MYINEIVFTERLFDVGLCIGEEDGLPIIHGRYSQYSDSIYGGVQYVQWVASGVYCTKDEWDRKTNNKMSPQDVMDVFGITKQSITKTPCKVEDGGWNELEALTAFLNDCECVKQDQSSNLAKRLMSKFFVVLKDKKKL